MNPLHRAAWKRRNPLADKTVFQLQKLARRGHAGAIMEVEARLKNKPPMDPGKLNLFTALDQMHECEKQSNLPSGSLPVVAAIATGTLVVRKT